MGMDDRDLTSIYVAISDVTVTLETLVVTVGVEFEIKKRKTTCYFACE